MIKMTPSFHYKTDNRTIFCFNIGPSLKKQEMSKYKGTKNSI